MRPLTDRTAHVEQMSDAELVGIVRNGSGDNPAPGMITIGPG
jgi:hypothetical protein